MTITLPLQPQEEARLMAAARARGLSAAALVREAIEGILRRGSGERVGRQGANRRSLRGLLQNTDPRPLPKRSIRTERRCSQISRALISDDRCHSRHHIPPFGTSFPTHGSGKRQSAFIDDTIAKADHIGVSAISLRRDGVLD